ncbi:hypothetical protein PYK79_57095 [Streptomyces sp. ID05-04B]|uniref:hypothetical protein n=1 Tax=Streptomyces sp. ID05-04B TaxID=3028661 RepID=UPI0029C48FAB|nr:hypothetical protein [Streptomyces sp. ID05-04B]MDX5570922.1 hypothetical protein [Streptomyces sp. ID05-04B]
MDTHRDHPELHYLVGNAGTGLAHGLSCAHGDTAVAVEFHGEPCKPGALPASIDTLIPRCGFAHIVGSVLAQIRHHEGEAAVDLFRDQVRLAESMALHKLQQL